MQFSKLQTDQGLRYARIALTLVPTLEVSERNMLIAKEV